MAPRSPLMMGDGANLSKLRQLNEVIVASVADAAKLLEEKVPPKRTGKLFVQCNGKCKCVCACAHHDSDGTDCSNAAICKLSEILLRQGNNWQLLAGPTTICN